MIIEDRAKLKQAVERLRKEGKKIVFTNGCFDILHRGHVEYLKKAKGMGDILIVGVNTDESIKGFKGPQRPVMPLESRMAVLDSLRFVDIVAPFGERLPNELIRTVKPDIDVKGGDYKPDELPEAGLVKSLGGAVRVIPFVEGYSVTSIIEKIKKA